jgi:hypothetical protein
MDYSSDFDPALVLDIRPSIIIFFSGKSDDAPVAAPGTAIPG